jgi:hypothetical protein
VTTTALMDHRAGGEVENPQCARGIEIVVDAVAELALKLGALVGIQATTGAERFFIARAPGVGNLQFLGVVRPGGPVVMARKEQSNARPGHMLEQFAHKTRLPSDLLIFSPMWRTIATWTQWRTYGATPPASACAISDSWCG